MPRPNRVAKRIDLDVTVNDAVSVVVSAAQRIVQSLTDALLVGAARLACADAAERERFIADHIAISERLIGLA